jgi:hypothetical protein
MAVSPGCVFKTLKKTFPKVLKSIVHDTCLAFQIRGSEASLRQNSGYPELRFFFCTHAVLVAQWDSQ